MFFGKKKVMRIAAVSMTVLLLMAGCSKEPVVAKVNGSEILKSEYESSLNAYKSQMEAQMGPDVWEQDINGQKWADVVKGQILDMLIDNKLIAEKAKEFGIVATEEDINKEIENAKAYFGDDAKFNEFLKAQNLTDVSLKEMIQTNLLFKGLYEKAGENATVNDGEIAEYYKTNKADFERVTASHILVETEDEAKAVEARLAKGEDFGALAAELSTDPSAAQNKGSLGSFGRGAMVPEFENAAFAMTPGEISAPVKTQFGFHVILLEDIKQMTLEESRDEIKDKLLETAKREAYEKLLDETRKAADIQRFEENM